MKNVYVNLAVLLIAGLCFSCNDIELPSPLSEEICYERDSFQYISRDGNTWTEVDDSELYCGYTPHLGNRYLWFKDDKLTCYINPEFILSYDEKFEWYANDEYLPLFGRTSYQYDESTGEFTTSNQVLECEEKGTRYFVERMDRNMLIVRIEYGQDYLRYHSLWGEEGVRVIYKPTTPPYMIGLNYKVFDTKGDAVDYIMGCLAESKE